MFFFLHEIILFYILIEIHVYILIVCLSFQIHFGTICWVILYVYFNAICDFNTCVVQVWMWGRKQMQQRAFLH